MKTYSFFFAITALAYAAGAQGATAPAASAQLLTQGFDDVSALDGWLLVNQSSPTGQNWFQGNSGIFSAQSGPANSYIAANFLSAQNGGGDIDNWLITPELNFSGPVQLSFYTRSAGNAGFSDTLEVRFGSGASADPLAFSQTLITVGGGTAYPDTWQRYTATVPGGGRFAFRYVGSGNSTDYIGLDSLHIAAVPEPVSYLLFGAGLGLLGLVRRRARRTLAAGLALAALGAVQPASAAQQGVIAVRDAETGELRAPTPAEAKALQVLEQQRQQAGARTVPAAPQVSRNADGTRKGHLGGQGAVYSVLRRAADGSTQVDCVTGAEAAQGAVTSATHKGEHRHAND